jgi:hypothetical protein
MRAPLHRASDWIYILLADWQRSPVPVMFEKRFGSPVGFRTYDPQVRSKMIFQCLQRLWFGAKDDFVAKIPETLEQPVCGALWTKSVEVVGPQLSIGLCCK